MYYLSIIPVWCCDMILCECGEINNIGKFLVEVDRLKSSGKLSDCDVLLAAYKKLNDIEIL